MIDCMLLDACAHVCVCMCVCVTNTDYNDILALWDASWKAEFNSMSQKEWRKINNKKL